MDHFSAGHFVCVELREQIWKVGFKHFRQKLSIDDCVVGTGDERDAEKKSYETFFDQVTSDNGNHTFPIQFLIIPDIPCPQ